MIHRYQLNGYNIVLDIYSGSVHVVDDLAYDVIGLYEDRTADDAGKVRRPAGDHGAGDPGGH